MHVAETINGIPAENVAPRDSQLVATKNPNLNCASQDHRIHTKGNTSRLFRLAMAERLQNAETRICRLAAVSIPVQM
jgi:hypothetical protein